MYIMLSRHSTKSLHQIPLPNRFILLCRPIASRRFISLRIAVYRFVSSCVMWGSGYVGILQSSRIASRRFKSSRVALYRFISLRIASHRFVSFRVASYRFTSLRIASYRFVALCVALHRFISLRITSYHFLSSRIASYRLELNHCAVTSKRLVNWMPII